jgi:hypothetical protein
MHAAAEWLASVAKFGQGFRASAFKTEDNKNLTDIIVS